MNSDILICGVGGQGTVLASKLIAAAAMEEGNVVHSAETIGMAQRGGSVTSHVRIGSSASSPLIPYGGADLLLAFEPSEAVRNLKYLKKDGRVIVNSTPVRPSTEPEGYDEKDILSYLEKKTGCIIVDGAKECEAFGSAKFFNIMVLGIAVGSGALPIESESMINEIEKRVPKKFTEINNEAFKKGFEIGELSHENK